MFFKDKAFTNWGKNIYINPKKISPKNYNELKKFHCSWKSKILRRCCPEQRSSRFNEKF